MNIFKEILEWIICFIIAIVIALLVTHFLVTQTVVKQTSMYPTLEENQRLIINRSFRITGKKPNRGDIVTFEAPTNIYTENNVNQNNPIAIYSKKPQGLVNKFFYYVLEKTKMSYIKRVIALEGELVEIKDGKVYINGEILKEEYLNANVTTKSDVFNNFVVPKGYIFVLGDNRGGSTDSRELGCIPLEKLEGIAVFRIWPLNKFTKY